MGSLGVRSGVALNASGDQRKRRKRRLSRCSKRNGPETGMKRALLGLAGLVALGAAAPAGAADLPVYTKTPAMVATIYDWSGFYVGVNGGGGSSYKDWDTTE